MEERLRGETRERADQEWDPARAERSVNEAERARGAFLGLAWGDVFGCPVEGWRPGSIAKVYGGYEHLPSHHPIEVIRAVGKSYARKLRPIGIYSDDTQHCMTLINLCLVDPHGKEDATDDRMSERNALPLPEDASQASVEPEGPVVRVEWNVQKWGSTLAEMFRRDALRDYGRHFKEAVTRLTQDTRPQQSGTKSEGMGATMRIGPLGALFRYDPEALAACAWESSLTTHATLTAGAMSYAVAFAVGCLVRGESVEEVREKLPDVVAAMEDHWLKNPGEWTIWATTENVHLISSCLRSVFSQMDLTDRDGLRTFIADNAKPHLTEGYAKAHVNQGHVLLGGLHGLIMALLPDIHPQEILREIVVLGYDTDTVAAICVLGARFGVGWIPLSLMLERERLQAYAEALVLAGRAEDKRRPNNLESLEEFIKREIELAVWGKEVKEQNAMTSATGS